MRSTTVLVVDDERAQRELLMRWLNSWSFNVRIAADARQALDAMLVNAADILLTDIKMPGHDGLWLAEQVRGKWPQTQIIMATGVVDVESMKRAQRLGAVDYVTKPYGRELLWHALGRAEQRNEKRLEKND